MELEQQVANAFTKGLATADKMPGEIGAMIRAELMSGLNIKNRQAFYVRSVGKVKHTDFERKGIEETFKKYGVSDPWGLA